LTGRVRASPSPVAISEYGDMSRQPAVIELGDQPVFIGGVEQSRRVQAVDQFSEPLETSHDLQRIPLHGCLPSVLASDRWPGHHGDDHGASGGADPPC
jgi:hypothetical protein